MINLEKYEESRDSFYLQQINNEYLQIENMMRKRSIKSFGTRVRIFLKSILHGNIDFIINRLFRRNSSSSLCVGIAKREVYKNDKIVIYTVLFGDYDTLNDPFYINSNCDYYVITNQKNIRSKVWKIYTNNNLFEITKKFSNLEKARYYKTHPHLLFQSYKYSIFIDANIQIVADLVPMIFNLNDFFMASHRQPGRDCLYDEAKAVIAYHKANKQEVLEQVKAYIEKGFPKHYGLFQTNILVREHNDVGCINLMDAWWEEMCKYTKRDQLSLTYVMWNNNIKSDMIGKLGENSHINPRIRYNTHK